MRSDSKLNEIRELFYDNPSKHWHFEEVLRTINIGRRTASVWLKHLVTEGTVVRIKQKGKMPYFRGNRESPLFFERKRLYGLQKLVESGIVQDLSSLKGVSTIVIFGSYSRGDWHALSDTDVFLIGKLPEKDKKQLQSKHHNLELHSFANKEELSRIRSPLLQNVVNGYFIKGHVQDLVKVST